MTVKSVRAGPLVSWGCVSWCFPQLGIGGGLDTMNFPYLRHCFRSVARRFAVGGGGDLAWLWQTLDSFGLTPVHEEFVSALCLFVCSI